MSRTKPSKSASKKKAPAAKSKPAASGARAEQAAAPSGPSARTLVVALGAPRDTLAALPLVTDLARAGVAVDAVVPAELAAPLGAVEGVTVLAVKDLEGLDADVAAARARKERSPEAERAFAELAWPDRARLYDDAVNVTESAMGAFVTTHARARRKVGGYYSDAHEWLFVGEAMIFRVALDDFRDLQLFHLADLARAASWRPWRTPAPDARMPAPAFGTSPALPEGRRVALVPGDDRGTRGWPTTQWAFLARALETAGFVPVVLTDPKHAPRGRAIALTTRRGLAAQLDGLSLPDKLAALAACEIVIASDGAPAQIAAMSGRPVVGVYGGGARFAEDAPYGAGNVVVQGAPTRPAAVVTVDAVVAATLAKLGQRSSEELVAVARKAQATLWETAMLPDGADPLGGLTYRPLHASSLDADDLLLFAQRSAFAATFRGSGTTSLDFLAPQLPSDRAAARASLDAIAAQLDPIGAALERLAVDAAKIPQLALRGDRATLESTAAGLTSGLEALARRAESAPLARPIIGWLEWTLKVAPELDLAGTFALAERAYRQAAHTLAQSTSAVRALLAKDG
jgi:ADP-heptose:LPS heptosyltransferase